MSVLVGSPQYRSHNNRSKLETPAQRAFELHFSICLFLLRTGTNNDSMNSSGSIDSSTDGIYSDSDTKSNTSNDIKNDIKHELTAVALFAAKVSTCIAIQTLCLDS